MRVGLVFDDFVVLMTKFGYAKIENIDLLNKIFNVMTGFIRESSPQKFQKQVPVLHFRSFRALIYCLRNCYDFNIVKDIKVYPEALDTNMISEHTFVWNIDIKADFLKFHKIMITLNHQKTHYETQTKKSARMKEIVQD